MPARDVVGAACDVLVGGMMFHSDHADLCRLLGIEWLARLHDDGYAHDAVAYRKLRRKAIAQTCEIPTYGRHGRTTTLDRWRGMTADEVDTDGRVTALRQAMDEWCSWERTASEEYGECHSRLLSHGYVDLADEMRHLAIDTEREHAEACALRREMRACGWDMAHVYDMGGR